MPLEIIPVELPPQKGLWHPARRGKKDGSYDIALVCADDTAIASGVLPQCRQGIPSDDYGAYKDGRAKAVINSGNANASRRKRKGRCGGVAIIRETANCRSEDILFNSTGVIGVPLTWMR